ASDLLPPVGTVSTRGGPEPSGVRREPTSCAASSARGAALRFTALPRDDGVWCRPPAPHGGRRAWRPAPDAIVALVTPASLAGPHDGHRASTTRRSCGPTRHRAPRLAGEIRVVLPPPVDVAGAFRPETLRGLASTDH